jgi:hypothetical protein
MLLHTIDRQMAAPQMLALEKMKWIKHARAIK